MIHYNHLTLVSQHLKTLAVWLFVLQHVQANGKENTKAPYYWPFVRGVHLWPEDSHHITDPLWGESTCDQRIVITAMWKTFLCHHVITGEMNSTESISLNNSNSLLGTTQVTSHYPITIYKPILKFMSIKNLNLNLLYMCISLFWYTPDMAWTSTCHHDGCRCPGAYLAPGHQQPTWWHDCDYCSIQIISHNIDIE